MIVNKNVSPWPKKKKKQQLINKDFEPRTLETKTLMVMTREVKTPSTGQDRNLRNTGLLSNL